MKAFRTHPEIHPETHPAPPTQDLTPPPQAFPPGSVTLVGAGPGDPELLTLKAVRALQAATVLLVDDLVSDAVLAYASSRARTVRVGKRGGCASTPQSFIEKLMLQAALEGEVVVRLKGGDPFLFGRGGEELDTLRAAGVPVQVVNGITAGLAAGQALGVALTHRAHASGVVFMTGHAQPGGTPTDWAALGAMAHTARLTLVIYMGVQQAPAIQAGLLQGLPCHTPVAVVASASLPAQRHACGPLHALTELLQTHQLASPSVILVGDVLQGLLALAEEGQPRQLALAA
jgi:uroporphyrin-III C-methyltransferase